MRVRLIVSTAIVFLLLGAACSGGSGKKEAVLESTTTTTTEPQTQTDVTRPDEVDGQPYDELLALSLTDIQDYWATTLPQAYGIEYTPIPERKLIAATPDNPPPPCGEEMSYADVEGNAFYCFPGEYVTWDNVELFPDLYSKFGTFTIALVLAHEWGHVVQGQAGITGSSILTELQADCFAGTWVRDVADGFSPNLELDPSAFQQALGGLLEFRDQPGTSADDELAHGSGFDRVNAFQLGYEDGVQRCVDFETDPPVIFEVPFETEEDFNSGGNLPVDEVVEASALDLNEYWAGLDLSEYWPGFDNSFLPIDALQPYDVDGELPTCGDEEYEEDDLNFKVFFCADDNYVGYDEALVEQVHEEIGDFGVATLLSFQWALSGQMQAGLTEETLDTSLQRACFTGSWAASILNGRTQQFTLSPGDLDETVQAFISFGDAPGSEEGAGVGSAFDLVTALRDGLFFGSVECASYTAGTTP